VRELRRQQMSCAAVTWVGTDELGDSFLDDLTRRGVDVQASDRTGTRSPTCHLYYSADNDPVLFYDAGDCPTRLSPEQRRVVSSADWVCLSVAPQAALRVAVDETKAGSALLWTVKSDPAALTGALARDLVARAEIITYSHSEAGFLGELCGFDPSALAKEGRLVVETRGPRGAQLWFGDRSATLTTSPATGRDTTGAGDTFAAALLCGVIRVGGRTIAGLSHDQVQSLVAEAVTIASSFLRNRDDRSPT
jgi:fructokinase